MIFKVFVAQKDITSSVFIANKKKQNVNIFLCGSGVGARGSLLEIALEMFVVVLTL